VSALCDPRSGPHLTDGFRHVPRPLTARPLTESNPRYARSRPLTESNPRYAR
jgi:hypothetical protein